MAVRKKTKKAKQRVEARAVPQQAEDISISLLRLDPDNPRLAEYDVDSSASEETLVRSLWTKMAVEEVAMSIAHNGFFRHEPLIVEKVDKHYVVLEGNRRLAGVRLLLDAGLRERVRATNLPDIDKIDPGRRDELQDLPCVVTSREAVWRYLGFKHVNGPATWGSYAKAQYIAEVHDRYGVPLTDIAQQIGDTHSTVERLYRGLTVIEQAESKGVFLRRNSFRKFGFSHIYTGLDKPGIQKFLGITDKKRGESHPVPESKIKHLGELCKWLYGDAEQEIEPVLKSQNPDLKNLDVVIQSREGLRSLRDGLPLNLSYDAALGDQRLFRNALHDSKQALQRARGTLSTGFDPSDSDAVRLAEEIEDLAVDLHSELQAKKRSHRRKRSNRKG